MSLLYFSGFMFVLFSLWSTSKGLFLRLDFVNSSSYVFFFF